MKLILLFFQFTAFLVVVFILEFSAGISGYVLRGSVSEVLEKKMQGSMSHYSNSTEIAGFWDEIQKDVRNILFLKFLVTGTIASVWNFSFLLKKGCDSKYQQICDYTDTGRSHDLLDRF